MGPDTQACQGRFAAAHTAKAHCCRSKNHDPEKALEYGTEWRYRTPQPHRTPKVSMVHTADSALSHESVVFLIVGLVQYIDVFPGSVMRYTCIMLITAGGLGANSRLFDMHCCSSGPAIAAWLHFLPAFGAAAAPASSELEY